MLSICRAATSSLLVLSLSLAGPLLAAEASHATAASQLGMPTAASEAEGFSGAGLDELNAQMHALVDQQKLAGVTTLIARHGKVISFDTYGNANAATGAPLKPDSIYRIASMTKPIVGTAMMQLYEQGKWKLDDPVSKYIPEFANLQVRKAGGGTEPMKSPMTMAELMSHTAGFGLNADYNDAKFPEGNLQSMIDKLAKMPLFSQPGTDWAYGPVVNIQGYLVEKLSGESLDVYLSEHILKSLGMNDTGFWVSPDKASRVVAIHTYDAGGKIVTQGENKVVTSKPVFLSGSGGLMSTAKDYWLFAQAMGNGGELNGKRVLKAETVKLMRKNVLKPGVLLDLYGPTQPGIGFGLDFAIVMDPKTANTAQGLNSFYWGGAFGTWFWIDPTNDLVFVGMIQNLNGSVPTGGTPHLRDISYAATYKALSKK
jgi:CubicO group peptidase (beta-lactamase class C family)